MIRAASCRSTSSSSIISVLAGSLLAGKGRPVPVHAKGPPVPVHVALPGFWNPSRIGSSAATFTATRLCLKPPRRNTSKSKKNKTPLKENTDWRKNRIQAIQAQLGELKLEDIPPADLDPAPALDPALQGPHELCIPRDEAIQKIHELEKEVVSIMETKFEKNPAARERIHRDIQIIKSGKATSLEYSQALRQAAKKLNSPLLNELIKLASRYRDQDFFEDYTNERAKIAPDLLQSLEDEMEILLHNFVKEYSTSSRIVKTVLDQMPPHERIKHYNRDARIKFQMIRPHVEAGEGASMLPTLPQEETETFNLIISDAARSREEQEENDHGEGIFIKPNEVTMTHVSAIYKKEKNVDSDRENMPDIRLLSLKTTEIQKGDVFSFCLRQHERTGCQLLRKRVTGLENDVVVFQGRLYRVPKGHFWSLGDNAKASMDSRHFGAVPLANLRLKTIFTLHPTKPSSLLDSLAPSLFGDGHDGLVGKPIK